MAKLLTDNGIENMHATTIAKLEAGVRAIRIDELAGIADLLGISVDTLLGRTARPHDDILHALRSLLETAQNAEWQVTSLAGTIRDRADELAAFDKYGDVVADSERACDQLTEAAATLGQVARWRDNPAFRNVARKLLLSDTESEQ